MSRVADFCPKCKLYYPGDCMKSGCQDRYCECDGCNAGEGVVFSKLSEKNTLSQSIVKVDPEGSYKRANLKPVFSCAGCEAKISEDELFITKINLSKVNLCTTCWHVIEILGDDSE